MKIPNSENAFVDIRKLRDYCLNREHPQGKHKARVFASALGLTVDDTTALWVEIYNDRGRKAGNHTKCVDDSS